jgi:hypothetical protein
MSQKCVGILKTESPFQEKTKVQKSKGGIKKYQMSEDKYKITTQNRIF